MIAGFGRWAAVAAAVLVAGCMTTGGGGPAQPAAVQPDAAALKPGLAVSYAYPRDVKNLGIAEAQRDEAQPGPDLKSLTWPDTERGQPALTSRQPEHVVAFIDGYIRVDKPGTVGVQFKSNDGLLVKIGGQEVWRDDGRHTCRSLGWQSFEAPKAGWYRIEALYFQRLNTSCLEMKWRLPGGGEEAPPASVFGH